MALQAQGAGPTIVLVHGLRAVPCRLAGKHWRYTKALQERFHVVTLDLRGHGRSDKPHHEDATAWTARRGCGGILDAAGAQAAHYVGYSAGSGVGFSLLASSPERVKTFTAAGGTYRSPAGQIESTLLPRI